MNLKTSLFVAALLLSSRDNQPNAAPPPEAEGSRPAVKGLSRKTAEERAARLSGVRYDLRFSIDADSPSFTGKAEIAFSLKDPAKPLTLDFAQGSILSLEVNGKAVAKPDYNDLFLAVPGELLQAGENRLAVAFSHPYSNSGSGLYRAKDPADGKTYAYTDFEPYDANQLFPCFDQPDLKAPYTLQVEAPLDWEVISTVRESEVRQAKGKRRLWVFPKSPAISTYLYSLHAGPYAVWSSSAEGIPLRLFARESLAEFVDVEEWFAFTRQGFSFYNAYFAYPYPFGKYDQILAPDFLSGAMENVAAVTFSERYIRRGKPTWRDREDLAGVILHEMAHMWFGNLVTMKWWDDLWLNESFATIMASLALAEATEFKDAWLDFFISEKQWAYWEDQLVTTHPIEAPVPDTEQAFANFDGITYGKGASTLKQAIFYLGADNFRAGVRRYLKDFAYGNAVRKDFMDSLAKAAGRPLDDWTRQWLKTSGVNTLKTEVSCRDGRIASLRLAQGAPAENPELRPHRTRLALYAEKDGRVVLRSALPQMDYAGRGVDLPQLAGQPCPKLVLANQGDHDYVKLSLDAASIETAKERLSSIEDDLDRAMLWMSLWEMVRDGELSVTAYAEILMRHLPKERDFQVAAKVAELVYGRRVGSASVLGYLAGEGEAWGKAYEDYTRRFEAFFLDLLGQAKPGSDLQKLWFDSYARVARGLEARARLKDALAGRWKLEGLELDQDRRWEIVAQMNRAADPAAGALIEAEKARDSSRRGQTAAIKAEVLKPDPAVKRAWFKTISAKDPGRAFEDLRAAMRHLFPPEQAPLRRDFASDFYSQLKAFAGEKPNPFLGDYAALAPVTCSTNGVQGVGRFLEENPGLPPVVVKGLKVARQEDERCLRVRTRAEPELSARKR